MLRRIMFTVMMALIVALPVVASKASKATTFESILPHYEAIRLALLNDSIQGISDHAKEIAELAEKSGRKFHVEQVGVDPAKADECVALLPEVKASATRLAGATTLEKARDAFGELSERMVRFRKMSTSSHSPKVLYCSMAKKSWLQSAEETGNPYYGQKMAKCGQVVKD